ncbi:uncharacterized protein METZ01_LOCUS480336, partial [marine metagenome]
MQLNDAQIAEFNEKGYLLFQNLLDSDEVGILQRTATEVLGREGPEVVREKDDPAAA